VPFRKAHFDDDWQAPAGWQQHPEAQSPLLAHEIEAPDDDDEVERQAPAPSHVPPAQVVPLVRGT
jgi:hypothetical protein